jgi:hypothetical protein
MPDSGCRTGLEKEDRQHERIRENVRRNSRDAEPTKTKRDLKRKAAVIGPTTCMWAAKLSQRNQCPVGTAEMKVQQGKGVEPQRVSTPGADFQVIGEPLYGGKGKNSGLIYNQCDCKRVDTREHAGRQPSPGASTDTTINADPKTPAYAGLDQPRLQSFNSVVLGDAKKQMRCENKQRRQALRAEQLLISPWSHHQGLVDTITPTDHTTCPPHRNSMCPNGRALQHPAAKLLKEWATFGCPTHTRTVGA